MATLWVDSMPVTIRARLLQEPEQCGPVAYEGDAPIGYAGVKLAGVLVDGVQCLGVGTKRRGEPWGPQVEQTRGTRYRNPELPAMSFWPGPREPTESLA